MRRFTIDVILISIAATLVWWVSGGLLRPLTVLGAKGLHWLVGYPAPYLLADLDKFYWFAPLFPPLVGLVLASRWVSWPKRIIGLLIGIVAFCYLVALQIVVVYTPYFTLSAVRAYLSSIQVSLNSVVVPVVLWLILTGGPPRQWATRSGPTESPDDGRKGKQHGRTSWLYVSMACIAFCGVLTLPILWAAEASTANLDAARNRLAGALIARDYNSALPAIDAMLQEQGRNTALSYVQSELHRELGDDEAADRIVSESLDAPRRLAVRQRRRGGN
jgi:hypothetical protein